MQTDMTEVARVASEKSVVVEFRSVAAATYIASPLGLKAMN